MMKLFKKPRKGLLLPILLFSIVMAVVSFGSLNITSTLYASNSFNAEQYASIQSYRSALEIATYQYVSTLCGLTSRRETSNDWLSATPNSEVTTAVDAILSNVGTVTDAGVDKLYWKQHSIISAVNGAAVSDASKLMDLLALLSKAQTVVSEPELALKLEDEPEVDWENASTNIDSEGNGTLVLKPVEVKLKLKIRGEEIVDTLFIDNFVLDISQDTAGAGSTLRTWVTVKFAEGDGGVQIYREES